jgi:drug/metabolite transporter (DMT)-like permease
MEMVLYSGIYLLGVFISSVSQVMLKKAAQRKYDNVAREYLNPLVMFAYVLFFATTLMTIYAYKVIPISLGPVLEATSYLYVTFFGVTLFKEKMGKKKAIALALIIAGIVVYAMGVQ